MIAYLAVLLAVVAVGLLVPTYLNLRLLNGHVRQSITAKTTGHQVAALRLRTVLLGTCTACAGSGAGLALQSQITKQDLPTEVLVLLLIAVAVTVGGGWIAANKAVKIHIGKALEGPSEHRH